MTIYFTLQGLKEFMNDASTLASLQHPFLCKLIGFHAREGSDLRMLVYERLFHGSLDRLLYGRLDGPPIDWNSRMKAALCAAQGLTFLHEEGPFQVKPIPLIHKYSVSITMQTHYLFCLGSLWLLNAAAVQAMFHEFSTSNIQIDKDFSAKLSGYGCISHIQETDISSCSVVSAHFFVGFGCSD